MRTFGTRPCLCVLAGISLWALAGCGADPATAVNGTGDDAAAMDQEIGLGDDATAANDAGGDADTAGTDATSSGGPCMSSKDCADGVCDASVHVCVGCLVSTDCQGGKVCLKAACVPAVTCQSDGQCKATNQVCDTAKSVCVDCLAKTDCATGQTCASDHTCAPAPKTCVSSKDCAFICDKVAGVCVDCFADTDCTAAQFCSASHACVADLCSGPTCAGGLLYGCAPNGGSFLAATSCDDNNACTDDTCGNAACKSTPKTGGCDDGNACTTGETCASGTCAGGSANACDDGLACTTDSCDPAKGCVHVAVAQSCSDNNPCTDDTCGATGCAHTANAAPCDDGNACTGSGTCANTTCGAGSTISCDDGDDCTTDSCNTTSGCVHTAIGGCIQTNLPACGVQADCKSGLCDPNLHMCVGCMASSDCGAGAYCHQHKCVSGPSCTSDMQCKATSQVCNSGWSVCVDCNTAKDCGAEQACVESKCVAALPCTSSKTCTGVCDGQKGVCVGCLTSADCGTGKICDETQTCVAAYCKSAQCVGGAQFSCNGGASFSAAISCDDGNDCTTDSCDPAKGGCWHANVADGSACGAGAACGAAGKCSAGACVGGEMPIWETSFGGTADDIGSQVLALADGFLIGGTTKSKGAGKTDVWLVRTDMNGKLVWDQTFGTAGDDDFGAVLPNGSGFVAVASANYPGGTEVDLVGTDGGGKQIWKIPSTGWYCRAAVAAATGFVIANQSTSGAPSELAGVDGTGNQTWTSPLDKAYQVNKIVVLSDGLAVSGVKATGSSGQTVRWLGRRSAAGGTLWDVTYPGDGNLQYWPYDLAAVADGFLIIGTQGGNGPASSGWILRTDQNGTKLWEKSFASQAYSSFNAVNVMPDGFLLLGATSGGGVNNAWMVRTDAFGNDLWEKTLTSATGHMINTAAATATGFALTGWVEPNGGNYDLWLARTDFWGNLTCATSGPCGGKSAMDCDDTNPCTIDQCDAAHNGCWHSNLSDGLTCATGKTCAAGVCK